MKKNYLLGLAALLTAGALVSCGNPSTGSSAGGSSEGDNPLAGTYDVELWVSEVEGMNTLTQSQVDAFEEANPGITINTTIEQVGEGDAATQMISDVEAGADIFCFAQDQLVRLVQAGAVAELGQGASATVREEHDSTALTAATVGEKLYCYPLTSDNGYFMYYDKSVISEANLDSFEAIIAECEAKGRNFSYEIEGSGWYSAGFFFATGCKNDWATDNDGNFTGVDDTFNSPEGIVALKGMQKLLHSTSYVNSSDAATFGAAVPSAVVVSGTWASNVAKEKLGDNYGATDLPSFTVDGQSYHIGSFSGNKLLGVKPQLDAKRAAVLQKLALWLTNETCQLERYNTLGWGPSNKAAQANENVQSDVALTALRKQNEYSKPQGQIHGNWWDIAKSYATAAKNAAAGDDAALQAALDAYDAAIDGVLSMDPEVARAFTVIGSMNGDTWSVDIEMEEVEPGVWVTKEPINFVAGDEFKVRQGQGWDVAFGKDGGNFVVDTAGSYNVKLTYDEAAGTGVVELVAA